MYALGGGYFMGDLNAYDLWLYSIVKKLNLIAISVEYTQIWIIFFYLFIYKCI